MMVIRLMLVMVIAGIIAGCGGDDLIDQTCDEPQRYQQAIAMKRIAVPQGLDPLNELAEMPIPTAKDAPVRAPGARCLELPPSAVLSN